VWALAQTEGY